MERRFLDARGAGVHLLERAADKPVIFGHAAVFYDGSRDTEYQLWDDIVERIMPGAFDKALAEGQDVRALFNHNPDYLLGRTKAETLNLTIDERGLAYEIDPGDTAIANDVRSMIKRGDLSGSSFAFLTTDEDWRKEDGIIIREIRGVDLFDVGPVTYPAYEGTDTGARSELRAAGLADARKRYEAWQELQEAEAARREREARYRELILRS